MQESVAPPGRGRRVRNIVLLSAAILIAAVIGAAASYRNSAALAILKSVARGFGYDVAVGSLDLNLSRAAVRDLRVRNAAGEPVLEARSVDVAFSLRDLLPGGKRLLGLASVEAADPHVTVIHHPDGSYNITLPRAPASPAPANAPPLNVRLRLTGGSVDLVDRFVAAPHERRARFSDVRADGDISPALGSYYHAGAVFDGGGGRYPIRGNARFDDPHGFELQHWSAARLPVAALANFVLSTHAITVEGGELRDLDLTLGALATPEGELAQHLGIAGRLEGGRVAAAALSKPVRDARAVFVVDNESAAIRSLDASLNGIPLHVSGSLYDFASPKVRFGLRLRGDLRQVRELSKDTAKLPLAGAVALDGLVEGSASDPLIFARVGAPRIAFGRYRLDGGRGFVGVSGKELDVLAASVRYGAVAVAGRAALQLQQHSETVGYATLSAPANSIPYAENLVPGMPLRAFAAVRGADARLSARGYLGGIHGSDRLDAPFSIAADGAGDVGPVVLQRGDGATIYARAAIDRTANRIVALVNVERLSLLPAPAVGLPGLDVPPLPPNLDARLDATLTGIVAGGRLASADGTLHAYGGWGDVHAQAAGTQGGLAARGRLTSSFDRLARFTGNTGAHGSIDVPFALTNEGRSTIFQIAGAKFGGASIRGLALQRADATLGLALPAIDIYAADLRIAGHDVTASGTFGNAGSVHVTAGDLDLQPLRAAGIPIAGGRATVIADVGGSVGKPTANVVAALGGARYANADLGGDAGLAYDGAALRIERATVTYGGAYAGATGVVSGLAPGHIAPRYDVRAQLEDADVATLARTVKNPLRYPAGTLDADLRVGGAGANPSFMGEIRIPEGSLNGLSFRDARVGLRGDARALNASGGQVTVGGTTIEFGGSASRHRQSATLRTRGLDLADFDDYFDEADVLAGTGSAVLAFDAAPRSLSTSAQVALRGARYRRFDLGSIDARVSTAGTTIQIASSLSGPNARVNVGGSVDLPAVNPRSDIVRRSYLDLQAQIAGVNLGSVLPAAGLSAPVFGTVDGSAVVRGRYPALSLSAHAALVDGVVGRIPIDRFTLAANAADGRGRLTDLSLAARGFSANATGTFGLRPADAFDLQARASSPDINELIATVTGKSPGVRGTLATRAHLTGTIAQPRLTASVDVANVAYSSVTLPGAHADLDASRAAVDLRNGKLTLPREGSVDFDGHAPFAGGALASLPIALDFAPHHVDIGAYSSLLPDGSVVQGIFDGNVGVRGSLAAPKLSGNLSFNNGSYRSNSFTNALTQIELDLAFDGTSVRIARLHARAAPGSVDGSGTLALRDLRDPIRGLAATADVQIVNAYISAPKYYSGYVDGTMSARKSVAAPLTIGGNLTFANARIPYTALLPSGGSTQSAAPALPNVAFNIGVTVARDVRVQSGPVDIGTTGNARLGGTLAKPTLDGQFTATDGTVALYRTFTVQNGSSVTFTPSEGITPSVDATAVTNVPDPPTDVLLRITGLSTHLHLAFSSEPAYSQQQILGLLVNAQALGAVSGVAQANGSGTGGVSIAGLGEGVLNTQLTQKFLQPFSSQLGNSIGLSDLNLNYSLNGAVSATARRKLGKNVSFVYGEQFGGPTPRSSFGINVGNDVSGAQLTLYQAPDQQGLGTLTPYLNSGFLAPSTPNYTLQSIIPPNGSGFVFSYQRRFW